jgi:hypothetical protein
VIYFASFLLGILEQFFIMQNISADDWLLIMPHEKNWKRKKSLQPLTQKLLSIALAWVTMHSSRSSVAKSVQ